MILQISAGLLWAGPTAYISGPSTDFQDYMEPAMTAAVNLAEKTDEAGARPNTVTGLGFINGFLPYKYFSLEAGFDYKSCGDPADDYPVYFNMKAGFAEGGLGAGLPAVVSGIFDAGTKAGRSNYNVVYAEAAKTAVLGGLDMGRFSAGWFTGSKHLLLDSDGDKDNSGLLAAWDRVIPEISDRLWASVDYMGTKSAYGSWNFGLAWKFNSKVSAIIGYNDFINNDFVDTYNVQLTLGLGGDSK